MPPISLAVHALTAQLRLTNSRSLVVRYERVEIEI